MNKPSRTALYSLVLAAFPFGSTLAGLGGAASSVDADRASLKGMVRVTSAPTFVVHEITTVNGLQVREYRSPGGKVFAVSWRGPRIPDLRQLLGSFYGEFAQAAASTPRYDHHHLSVTTSNVVVQSSGHTRSFFGRAWVPTLLPENFAVEQIN